MLYNASYKTQSIETALFLDRFESGKCYIQKEVRVNPIKENPDLSKT